MLLYNSKGHSTEMVKYYTKIFRSENDEYDICSFDIMAGGINPVRQPIDKFIDKVFKGQYWYKDGCYIFIAPEN